METLSSNQIATVPVFVLGNPAARQLSEDLTQHATEPGVVCPRCGSEAYHDVPIHKGRTIRRDCARCGLFLDFPVWHAEKPAGRRRRRMPRKPR